MQRWAEDCIRMQIEKKKSCSWILLSVALHCKSQVIFVKICIFVFSRKEWEKYYFNFFPSFVSTLCSDIRNISFSRWLTEKWKTPAKLKEALDCLRFVGFVVRNVNVHQKRNECDALRKRRLWPNRNCKTISFEAQDLLVCISVRQMDDITAPRIYIYGYGVIFIYPFPLLPPCTAQCNVENTHDACDVLFIQFLPSAHSFIQMANNILKFNAGK